MKRSFSRRRVIASLGAIMSAPWIVPSHVLGAGDRVPPSDRIALGIIGTGDHGINRNIKRFLPEPDCTILAVCDVDRDRRLKAKQLIEDRYASQMPDGSYGGCDDYNDFREVIARDDIDAVMIATPDHWHVIPAVLAAQAGKDVMCEKPLSLTVHEGRVLSDVIHNTGRIFQTATENRSDVHYHRMCERVRNGRIGKLHTIHVGLPAGHNIHEASFDEVPPPEGMDYDFWLGPAFEAPYCEARCHWNFRWLFDYSGGMLTDWGAHMIDLAQWGNDTEYTGPTKVSAIGTFPREGLYNTATRFRVECEFANGVTMIVNSASPYLRFEGSEGWIGNEGWRGEPRASSPDILSSEPGENETRLYTCFDGEQRNFLDGIKTRTECYSPAELGHRTITIAHLGNISMLLGRPLRWDADAERVVDDPAANWMLSRPQREPWVLDRLVETG